MTNNKLIKLYSKDKKSLKRFMQLLHKINSEWKNLKFGYTNIKKKRKKITILKSPHVNKKAQTQFQSITYGALIMFSAWEVKKNYILLKKIKNNLFPDVKIRVEQTVSAKRTKVLIKNQFLPKKVHYYSSAKTFLDKQKQKNKLLAFNNDIKNKKILLNKTLQFIKILDHYGNFN